MEDFNACRYVSARQYLVLRVRYAMPGTDIGYTATRWRGESVGAAIVRYRICYLPTRVLRDVRICPVLTWCMVLRERSDIGVRASYAMSGTDLVDGATRELQIFLKENPGEPGSGIAYVATWVPAAYAMSGTAIA
eukprot:2123570-Rhodomonas_salina.2